MKWRSLLQVERRDLTPRIGVICGLLFIVGCVITFIIYFTHSSTLQVRQQELISRVHSTIYNNLQREMDRNLDALRTLKTAFLAQHKISREQFHVYTKPYLQSIKSIQALEWVPRIPGHQRDSLERAVRQEGFPDFQLFKRRGDSILRVENRDEYFPVFYIEPFEKNKEAFGFDPGAEGQQRYRAIQQAIASGNAAASDLMNLVQDKRRQHAILVFIPIYEDELRSAAPHKVHSLVEGVYLINSLVEAAFAEYEIPNSLIVELKEAVGSQTLLFTNRADRDEEFEKEEIFTSSLKMADREWQLSTYNPGSNPFAIIHPYWILGIGFFLACLISLQAFRFLTDNRKALREYAKRLEIKNRELEQYAYVAAHDLQEPLHTISSLITLVKDDHADQLDDRSKGYIQLIGDASERMKSLIHDLLNYSRMVSMETPRLVNCNELVSQVLVDMNQLIQERHASVQFQNLPSLMGYATALRQLFLNLIINGIKFQPPGQSPVIVIEASKQEDSAWLFTVKDNGIGIATEHHELVFALFRRLHRKEVYQGNGIGLTYCKKAVEMHNGEIWIESSLGKGSTFKFFLNLENTLLQP